MRLLQDIVNDIIKAGICDEMDSDIFAYVKPKDPDNIVMISEYKGSKVATFTNTNVRSVQILTRNKRNLKAQEKLWKIYDLLHTNDNIIMIGDKLSIISIRHTPMSIGCDEKGRYEWILNVGITYDNNKRGE